jgi:hypothetical protein
MRRGGEEVGDMGREHTFLYFFFDGADFIIFLPFYL